MRQAKRHLTANLRNEMNMAFHFGGSQVQLTQLHYDRSLPRNQWPVCARFWRAKYSTYQDEEQCLGEILYNKAVDYTVKH